MGGCLAISGLINIRQRDNHVFKKTLFVCIWDWASNVLGLTLTSKQYTCNFSKLLFGYGGMTLFHYHVHDYNHHSQGFIPPGKGNSNIKVQKTKNASTIRKDIYNIGILSPPSTTRAYHGAYQTGGWVDESSALFLSSNLIAIPFVSQSTSSMDTSLEWKEFSVPNSYANEYGPAQIAAIGKKNG